MKSVILIFSLLTTPLAFSQENRTEFDIRDDKKYGVFLGLGSPYPSLIGINLGYNIQDLRITTGFAEVETTSSLSFDGQGWTSKKMKATSYDVGLEHYFDRGAALRPLVGAHMGYVEISGSGELEIQGFSKDTLHSYINVGLDYMSETGYQVAFGFNQGLVNNSKSSIYINTGMFF